MNPIQYELNLVNKDAEMNVLGSYIKEPQLLEDSPLQAEHFYFKEYSRLMEALLSLQDKRIQIDLVSIVEEIGFANLHDIGGQSTISLLAGSVPTTSNVRYYEKLVLDYHQKRKAIEIAESIKQKVLDGENDHLSDTIQDGASELMNLDSNDDDDDDGRIQNTLVKLYDKFESVTGDVTGIPTGFNELDRMTSGFQDTDLIIVGARPSIGKTAFALNIAQQAGQKNAFGQDKETIVAIFSLEMSDEQLLQRMICIQGNINGMRLRNARQNFTDEDWSNLTSAIGVINDLDLRIFDKAGQTMSYIWKKVKRLRKQNPTRKILVLIDYLQLIVGNPAHRGNRQQEISEISRTLKTMARQFKMPVIALSQLSRGVEQRQDKRPIMSDLRESGSIEQDADIIAFLYRDDYYDRESENKNIIEIILAKQRNGPVGTVQLAFVKEYSKFVNLERRYDDSSSQANG